MRDKIVHINKFLIIEAKSKVIHSQDKKTEKYSRANELINWRQWVRLYAQLDCWHLHIHCCSFKSRKLLHVRQDAFDNCI